MSDGYDKRPSALDRLIRFCLEKKVVVGLLVAFAVVWGIMVAPFDWEIGILPRDPVPVDAIPDIGENQQIVFAEWPGRSPRDVEDQITYPLTVSLLGIPGVKTVRSYSMFGFSSIYVIFDEKVEFYWSRSRVLEKLNSLPPDALADGVRPTLGPDATALGQVFWYTLEGRDSEGNPAGGWDPHELRTIQDWFVRYSLLSAEGVSEVASIGGFVKEYQIDVDPDAMRASGITLQQVLNAARMSNLDVGAKTIEVNKVEYVIRGVGFIRQVEDMEAVVVGVSDNIPIRLRDVARVSLGPAFRRGALDKGGVEAVGGVVVVRYGENPLAAIRNVKDRIAEISPGLPRKTLDDGRVSRVTIVPFYDRSGLIHETLGTLNTALVEEILVSVIVILIMVLHLRSSLLISGLLPLAVLMCFIAMKLFGVDANIVALSGIAIAIGTMVDMGIIICENILRRIEIAPEGENRLETVYRASTEVGSAVLTAVATTIISFLPVFTMSGAEGKLFKPLALTKTFALFASVIVALTIIPPVAHLLFRDRLKGRRMGRALPVFLILLGAAIFLWSFWWMGLIVAALGVYRLFERRLPEARGRWTPYIGTGTAALIVSLFLAGHWEPLGPEKGFLVNSSFVMLLIGGLLGAFFLLQRFYGRMLRWSLDHRALFMVLPLTAMLLGVFVWLGFDRFFGWLPRGMKTSAPYSALNHAFPGLGREFMPPLDEGSFLWMPTTMPHASIDEVMDVLRKQDLGIHAIPEVETVVGKLGRAESPLDPAPISMIETVINYHPQFISDRAGNRLTFRFHPDSLDLFRDRDGAPLPARDGEPYLVRGAFVRDSVGSLVPERGGMPFRLWRLPLDPSLNEGREAWPGIRGPDDIWDEIVRAAEITGTTSAPRLQPIAARIVMLQSGMRAPMGLKVKGPDLETIERVSLDLERLLKEVPAIEPSTVIADRIIGKPYLEIRIDRERIGRYGIMIENVQEVIMAAVGGMTVTTTVEGRERYAVRVRYLRELRDNIEALGRIFVHAPGGAQVPLEQLADIEYVRGPDMIKSEDTFLVGYVLFDKKPGWAEVDVVEQAQRFLDLKVADGELEVPAGASWNFAGNYENQLRAQKTLAVVLPLALFTIFIILYLQFSSVITTLIVFSGIFLAWSGGFILIWLYGQGWFMDFSAFGVNLRELFQVGPINLSVAVWVGFLALFGIASDDGVVMSTYLDQSFRRERPETVKGIRDAAVQAGLKRVRPCLMTTATTVLALIPVLTSTGRGSDIMVPMAIPTVGGMFLVLVSLFMVPSLYSLVEEIKQKSGRRKDE